MQTESGCIPFRRILFRFLGAFAKSTWHRLFWEMLFNRLCCAITVYHNNTDHGGFLVSLCEYTLEDKGKVRDNLKTPIMDHSTRKPKCINPNSIYKSHGIMLKELWIVCQNCIRLV